MLRQRVIVDPNQYLDLQTNLRIINLLQPSLHLHMSGCVRI